MLGEFVDPIMIITYICEMRAKSRKFRPPNLNLQYAAFQSSSPPPVVAAVAVLPLVVLVVVVIRDGNNDHD